MIFKKQEKFLNIGHVAIINFIRDNWQNHFGKYSRYAFCTISLCILISGFLYYPKWKKSGSEATLSWDVSGYYLYLPAIFIYNDVKKLDFFPELRKKYGPTPDFQQAYEIDNGHRVLKYSSGMAVMYSPFFLMAHIYSKFSWHPSDGFSRPYQFFIHSGSIFYGLLGLFLWLIILRKFFSDEVAATTAVAIALGSNYLEYTGITNAMAHNYLCLAYASLILLSIRFKANASYSNAVYLGLCCGLMALCRPTEAIAVLIPLFWGFELKHWREHLNYLLSKWKYIIVAAISMAAIGSIQLIYWKYVSGSWIQYSYQDQGFSWLRPHLYLGLFHFRAGWLIYAPIMIFSLIGMYFLWTRQKLFWLVNGFILLFIYIAFAWDIWWYGGSLGQRTMVQIVPLLSLPFAAFVEYIFKKNYGKIIFGVLTCLGIYWNVWITHHAHLGTYFFPEKMTQQFYLHAFNKTKISNHAFKLLDVRRIHSGFRKNVKQIFYTDFHPIDSSSCQTIKDDGSRFLCLDEKHQFSPRVVQDLSNKAFDWLRINVVAEASQKEYIYWRHTQLVIEIKNNDEIVRRRAARMNRFLREHQFSEFFLDVKKPSKPFTKIECFLWHAESKTKLNIDKLWIETFES